MGQVIHVQFGGAVVKQGKAKKVEPVADRIFSYDEAQEIAVILKTMTTRYQTQVDALIDSLVRIQPGQEARAEELETKVNGLIERWQNQVMKLGAKPKGLWIADLDSGDGYYCWKFPESRVDFWHKYTDGYSKRVAISENTKFKNIPKVSGK